ncbi:hypothetical protein ACH34T_02450 [Actinomadura sp. 9N215]
MRVLAPDPASPPAGLVDAAWRDWLDEHDDGLWSLLKSWNRPAPDPERHDLSLLALGADVVLDASVLVETAFRFDHPIGERARARLLVDGGTTAVDLFCSSSMGSPEAIAFCLAHHLAPSDDAQRALFFVRTGQHEQHRALDPDATLLALAYKSAPPDVRASLRTVMTEHGDIDALRVLAGTSGRQNDFGSLTEQERRYLVRQLADRGDWGRLWPLTLRLPLAEAVDAVRAFGEWEPSDPDGRHVFQALRAADPGTVRECVQSLTPEGGPPPGIRISLADLDPLLAKTNWVKNLDFAPDGAELAFAGTLFQPSPGRQKGGYAGVIDLHRKTMIREFHDFPNPLGWVAHLGSDTIVVAEDARSISHASGRDFKIYYAGRNGVQAFRRRTSRVTGLERVRGDRRFILSTSGRKAKDGRLFTGRAYKSLVRSEMIDLMKYSPTRTAVEPDRRRIAVQGHTQILVAELDGSAVNHLELPLPGSLLALSPSVLVSCTDVGTLHIWHEPITAKEPAPWKKAWTGDSLPIDVVWSPALDRFLAVRKSFVEFLDIPLADDTPTVFGRIRLDAPQSRHALRLSPDGDVLALGSRDGWIDLYAITRLAARRDGGVAQPLGLVKYELLTDVEAALTNPALDDDSRATLELLRTCLEYRFSHDVGIGDATGAVAASDDDIELGR